MCVYLSVCMYVCMYICVFVCVYMYEYVCVCNTYFEYHAKIRVRVR